ncbi:ROK family protein [Patescibacteria group bacterium]|jgi:glucokinase|nr:ROK family protein [Patescibacteria group bacterium]HRT11150.1 ROK family protein [Patescibacteria group bacterium]
MKQQLNIGLDIGGSKILGLLYDHNNNKAYAALRQPIIKDSLPALVRQIHSEIERLIEAAQKTGNIPTGIGIGIPGVIKNGRIINCPNLSVLNNRNLNKLLAKQFPDKKILSDNDVNCFLRAYLVKHPLLKNTTFAVVALGTGIGGAIAINGNNIIPELGISSEIGHMIINSQSGADLEHYYHKIMGHPAGRLFTAAQAGDFLAQQKVEKFAKILGLAMVNLNNLINPKVIILTGGVSRYYKTYLPLVKQIINEQSLTPNRPKWIVGQDQKAAAIGASLLL